MRPTFHLVPSETWDASDDRVSYAAASLATEGFAHATDGLDELGRTFDRHYARDPRTFVALTLDLDALEVPWRYDVPDSPYPHVYGPIPRDAIIGVADVVRDAAGRFETLRER